jgi:hypothetical protein
VFVCVFLLCRKCYPLMKVLCDKETNIVKYHTARLVTFLLYYRYIRRRRTATKTKKVSDIVIICECGGNRLVCRRVLHARRECVEPSKKVASALNA